MGKKYTYVVLLTDMTFHQVDTMIDQDRHTSEFLRSCLLEEIGKKAAVAEGVGVKQFWHDIDFINASNTPEDLDARYKAKVEIAAQCWGIRVLISVKF